MYIMIDDKKGVKKSACLAILERVEAYAKELIGIHSQETILAENAWPHLHLLVGAFIEALKGSEMPEDLHDEIIGRVGKAIVSVPEGVALNNLREALRGLRSHLQMQYTCEKCGKVSECSPTARPNFKCLNCGYEHTVLFRRELMDLNDPVEGELAMRIFAGACGWKRIDGK